MNNHSSSSNPTGFAKLDIGSAARDCEAPSTPEVWERIFVLESRIENLISQLVATRERLEPVLRPSGPTDGEAVSKAPNGCAIAARLQSQIERCNYAQDIVSDIGIRLEI